MKTALFIGAAFSLFLIAAIGIQGCAKKGLVAGDSSTNVKKNTNPDNEGVYTLTDKMPGIPYNIGEFMGENVKYPEYAKAKKIEGRVIVTFIVREDGSIANATVKKSPHQSLSDEALRVINKMPAWIPGERDGKKVSVYYTIPIVFKLS